MGIVYELRGVEDEVLYVGQTSPNAGFRLAHHLRYQPWAAEVRAMVFAHVDVDPASILLLEKRHAAERAPKYGNWSSTPPAKSPQSPGPRPLGEMGLVHLRRAAQGSVGFSVCPAAIRLAASRLHRSITDLATAGAIPHAWVPNVRLGRNFVVSAQEARLAAARLDLPLSELTCGAT